MLTTLVAVLLSVAESVCIKRFFSIFIRKVAELESPDFSMNLRVAVRRNFASVLYVMIL